MKADANVVSPERVAVISPMGWSDLGNSAIVDSVIYAVRARMPAATVFGLTLNPADTSAKHGIEAYTCAAYSLPFYPVLEPGSASPPDPVVGHRSRASSRGARLFAGLLSALKRAPIRGALRTWSLVPFRMIREPAHFARSRERLRGASTVVVAGGGQLDAAWGGMFGHPYVLWRWGRLARAVGARFIFASVGTGSLPGLSRQLVLRALALADYRSFRDERSRDLLRAPDLTGRDPVVPDLAYALPVRPTSPPAGDRLVVGISPMNFRLPGRWPRPEMEIYRRHIRTFAELAARILADGHEVVVFATDDDGPAIEDTMRAIADLAPGSGRARFVPLTSVDALLRLIGSLDAVVVARLHGVLLSHLAHRPVMAVAHERKVRTLMAEVGHTRYCFDIADFDPEAGYERLRELAAEREALTSQIAAVVERNRQRVLAQYDVLFGPVRQANEPTS